MLSKEISIETLSNLIIHVHQFYLKIGKDKKIIAEGEYLSKIFNNILNVDVMEHIQRDYNHADKEPKMIEQIIIEIGF